jgi:thymidylate synthase
LTNYSQGDEYSVHFFVSLAYRYMFNKIRLFLIIMKKERKQRTKVHKLEWIFKKRTLFKFLARLNEVKAWDDMYGNGTVAIESR